MREQMSFTLIGSAEPATQIGIYFQGFLWVSNTYSRVYLMYFFNPISVSLFSH